MAQALRDGKMQVAQGPTPGMGTQAAPGASPGAGKQPAAPQRQGRRGSGPGGGRNGSGAGFASVPNRDEQRRLNLARKSPNARIGSKVDPTRDLGPSLAGKAGPEARTRLSAPMYDVYAQQKRVAEGAVSRESVPAPYQKQVKSYFESIRP